MPWTAQRYKFSSTLISGRPRSRPYHLGTCEPEGRFVLLNPRAETKRLVSLLILRRRLIGRG